MNCTKIFKCSAAIATAIFSSLSSAGGLETRNLTMNGQDFTVEIAEKTPDIALGLANRAYLAPNSGMLLAYPANMEKQCVWMIGTLIPLSAAFFDEKGVVLNVVDSMTPGSEKYHCAEGRAIFVIEMNAHWFANNGITTGAKLHNLRK